MTWGKASNAELMEALQGSLVSLGILPFGARKSIAPLSGTKKSIHFQNYAIKHYVDVKSWKPLGWNLPSNGVAYELCGHIWYDEGKGCLNVEGHPEGKVYVKLIGATCFRFECPVCYQKACAREAGNITDKFMRLPGPRGARRPSAEDPVPGLGRPIHVVFSVPEKDSALMNGETLTIKQGKFKIVKNYELLKKMMYKIAKKVGIKGGCAIIHPYANDEMHEDENVAVSFDKTGNVDLEWLKKYFDKQDRHVSFWYERPHFHAICYGWIDEDAVKEVYEETGWVVKNLGVRDSVFNTAFYQLSHCGVKKGVQVVTWFGCMSNRNYNKLEPFSKVKHLAKCSICGELLRPVRWEGEGDPPLYGRGEGGYWVDPGGWRYLEKNEKNHSCFIQHEGGV